ncbi:MAG: hypothetical protein JW783_00380 [Bacteroidales bacterium]|nr:hypothetical protein [Bacteroidales bacterium]MBN2748477.1 hypothetical protein [Bacteroidales bacterium]
MINFLRLIRLLLPPSLRGGVLTEFVRVMLQPIVNLYYALLAYISRSRLYKSVTSQTCWLQYILERELGVKVSITELDGKPTDFLVQAAGVVDESRLIALVNKYKMAGRSFTLNQAGVDFTAEWSDYVCEKTLITTYIASWDDYVCVKTPIHLSVVDEEGNLQGLLGFSSSSGDYRDYLLIDPDGHATFQQISAKIGGQQVNTNTNCQIRYLEDVGDYKTRLSIVVTNNYEGLYRQWVFRFSNLEETFDLIITQNA